VPRPWFIFLCEELSGPRLFNKGAHRCRWLPSRPNTTESFYDPSLVNPASGDLQVRMYIAGLIEKLNQGAQTFPARENGKGLAARSGERKNFPTSLQGFLKHGKCKKTSLGINSRIFFILANANF
jgi:hypothetical protein